MVWSDTVRESSWRAWRRRQRWICRPRGKGRDKLTSLGDSGGGGSVDRDSGSGLVAVELTSVVTAAAVDPSKGTKPESM